MRVRLAVLWRMDQVKIVSRYEKYGDPYIRVRLTDGRVMYEHRFLVEMAIGRKLGRKEVVHHKDGNRRNNKLSNLELKTLSAHSRSHAKRQSPVTLICPACGVEFQRTGRYVRNKSKNGQVHFFCGRSCRVSTKSLAAIPAYVHGKRTGYTYWGCRCRWCTEAQTVYMRGHRLAGRRRPRTAET